MPLAALAPLGIIWIALSVAGTGIALNTRFWTGEVRAPATAKSRHAAAYAPYSPDPKPARI